MFIYKPTRNNTGFTLIELLVVISIIGLLSTLAVYAINVARVKARDSKRAAEVRQIISALELYLDENGYYPQYTSSDRCNTTANNSLQPLVTAGFLQSIPTDPINTNQTPNRLCYEYIAGATWVSGWYCNGRPRTDYVYAFHFSTESTDLPYFRLTDSGGTPNNEYKYCIVGDLK